MIGLYRAPDISGRDGSGCTRYAPAARRDGALPGGGGAAAADGCRRGVASSDGKQCPTADCHRTPDKKEEGSPLSRAAQFAVDRKARVVATFATMREAKAAEAAATASGHAATGGSSGGGGGGDRKRAHRQDIEGGGARGAGEGMVGLDEPPGQVVRGPCWSPAGGGGG